MMCRALLLSSFYLILMRVQLSGTISLRIFEMRKLKHRGDTCWKSHSWWLSQKVSAADRLQSQTFPTPFY